LKQRPVGQPHDDRHVRPLTGARIET